MSTESIIEQWQQESEAVLSGVAEWRTQHPQATWREIEQAVDERLGRLRSKLLQETAQQSQKRAWSQHDGQQRPQCPACQVRLHSRGSQQRTLQIPRWTGILPLCSWFRGTEDGL